MRDSQTSPRDFPTLITFDESDDEEDLEGHGTAEYDTHKKWWVVEFDEQGVRYVPAKERTPVTEFNCVSCGKSLVDHSRGIKTGANCGMIVHKGVLKLVDSCPYCSTPIHAPIAPPKQ